MKATVQELIQLIGESVMRAYENTGGDGKVFDIHVFIQPYGDQYYTVHCDQSFVPNNRREEYEAAEQALREELPNMVFDLSYDEDAHESVIDAFDAEMEITAW